MSDDLMNEVSNVTQYDNRNSGAAFATNEANVMRGPFNLDGDEGTLIITKREVEDRTMYALTVVDTDGELMAGGSMTPTDLISSSGVTPDDVDDPKHPPKFRGSLRPVESNEEVAVVVWLARSESSGLYLQVRPDANRTDVANF